MARIYITVYTEESMKWREWAANVGLTWENFTAFPMCDGIRLDGVSFFPYPKPEFARYEVK